LRSVLGWAQASEFAPEVFSALNFGGGAARTGVGLGKGQVNPSRGKPPALPMTSAGPSGRAKV